MDVRLPSLLAVSNLMNPSYESPLLIKCGTHTKKILTIIWTLVSPWWRTLGDTPIVLWVFGFIASVVCCWWLFLETVVK